jgi:hypothetical protein
MIPDFTLIDMEGGWERPAGYPPLVESKTLADTLDETARTGHRTLLMRYHPGAADDRVLTHEQIEEVWMLEGEMLWLGGDGSVVQRIPRHGYVCRPPGVPHGPFRSDRGCLMLAMFYYPT